MQWNKPKSVMVTRPLSAALFLALIFVLTIVALMPYGGTSGEFWRRARCVLIKHEALYPRHRFEGFFTTTTVEQRFSLEDMNNCQINYDNSNVAYISLQDPKKIGTFRVTIDKDFDDYVFFPRVSQGSEVIVCEGRMENMLFRLRGEDGWTPIGRRYLLNLSCCEHNTTLHQFPVTLTIVLQGQWSQVWLPAGAIFFR